MTIKPILVEPNKILRQISKPVEKVGVYVPGGKASYPSSVLMNCIPASIAGVNEIFMTVPSFDGGINPGVLYAAKKCGVKKIFKLGGAQAIAAFAFGTKTVPKGPGSRPRATKGWPIVGPKSVQCWPKVGPNSRSKG